MGMKINAHLPIPADLKAEYPIPSEILRIKEERDKEIRQIFEGKSDKFLVIVGPCSADNEDSVCEYVSRLAKVNEKVSDRLMIVPRIYTNKPRTTGEGYKGMLHQPKPMKRRIFWPGSLPFERCISEQSRKVNLQGQTRCYILKTEVISMIFCHMRQSVPDLWKISSIV